MSNRNRNRALWLGLWPGASFTLTCLLTQFAVAVNRSVVAAATVEPAVSLAGNVETPALRPG